MSIRPAIPPSEITPREVFERRREFLRAAAATLGSLALPVLAGERLASRPGPHSTGETPTPYKSIASYNNFYEFGTDKTDPFEHAQRLRIQPWTLRVEGLVQRPRTFGIEELLRLAPLEERIYRLRCVEGWSMVIPWIGYSLEHLLKTVEPLGNARYVEFISATQSDTMPELRRRVLDWPYTEGLRLDEARHPLSLLVFGLYGEVLPKQNGAPLRLAVPWKYGFKSAKSLVAIRLVEKEPLTSWVKAGPGEYGFYSNVNPTVDHPRWSQARERRIGEFFKRETLMFNGYGDQVASLYNGMDLKKYF
ncbi:protein-methionine-sulfoxide reductase catalytic subunit MsrP [Denitratisoma oestradiolicum]|uniref:Protein-methionine-sulfoxide reductase catalytic subunit MsrP n=1 Tax=Denitratisoma oestradiolicum TaxID=311182 RepID=A0A6S6XSB5_9PROT|nr:protein-methionine-sulfoxide reductase catalytic subunit MsrP [Denitratisoma oestradiolicum]TWO80544.1 mononuclear molybdenum enzyme YedY [Denitratisoma oestradiolicum]CAB1367615.1 exported heme-molybdoenzyme molybdopterin-containing subunit YedY; TAT export [Denitratisoma oestradiolicum]